MLALLKNRNFILLLAIGLGLGLPQASTWTEVLMLQIGRASWRERV